MKAVDVNIVSLAYLGDAVFELYVRDFLIKRKYAKVQTLQKEAIKFVSAKSQARILDYLIINDCLSEEELAIVKRGRNYRRVTHPKNTDVITYKISTGFEALFGALFVERKNDRIRELMDMILEGYYEKDF